MQQFSNKLNWGSADCIDAQNLGSIFLRIWVWTLELIQDLSFGDLSLCACTYNALCQGSDPFWFLRKVLILGGQIWENKSADFGHAVWFCLLFSFWGAIILCREVMQETTHKILANL